MIPELEDGVLPLGIHLCSFDEVRTRFGQFNRTDKRIQLTETLERFIIRDPAEAGKETRCQISAESDDLLEIAKESLDHPIIVRGTQLQDLTRKKTYPLRVEEIEIFDEGDPSTVT